MSNNYLKLVRRLKLWVIILAILNITIISTIGVNMYRAKKSEIAANRNAEGINNFFANYLNLNESQKLQFDSIFAGYNISLKEVGVRLRDVKERLNTPGVESDSVVMNKIYEDFIAAQSLNRDLTVKLYNDIRDICSPSQASKFNSIISQTIITQEHHKKNLSEME